jgi:hypothetical protein
MRSVRRRHRFGPVKFRGDIVGGDGSGSAFFTVRKVIKFGGVVVGGAGANAGLVPICADAAKLLWGLSLAEPRIRT